MASKYIAPQQDIRSFTCPHCNTVSQMQFDRHQFHEDFQGNGEPVGRKLFGMMMIIYIRRLLHQNQTQICLVQ